MQTAPNIKAVIVYMARSTERDIRNLKRSLGLLDRNFNDRFHYPVIVFHEDFTEELKGELRASTRSPITFELLEFALPEFLDPAEVPDKVLGRFGVGYRHMCRFFGGMMYRHPAMLGFDWYWRLDTDSFLLGKIGYDVFEYMAKRDLWYGYMVMLEETPSVVEGLWDATRAYIAERNLRPARMNHLLNANKEWNYLYYYNNFEICSLSFGRSAAYTDYFDYLDRLGGIYKYRWGDAPIRTLAVALLVPEEKTHRFTDVPYAHAGYYSHRWHEFRDRLHRYIARKLGGPIHD
jgi:alpha 1,2-mannosyltransferase